MQTVEGKVVVLGSQDVGKTSIIARYLGNVFNRHVSPTMGASFFTCRLNIGERKVKLQVWDTAGQERFKSMAPMYYRNANAAMLVFDLSQYSTFTAIKGWVTELKRNVEGPMVLAVIGNKSDLMKERQVDEEEGRSYATKIGASYHETSVMNNEGIENVFLAIAIGLSQLSDDNEEINASLKIFDLTNSDMVLTPSEENSQNMSIALGTHVKPHSCC